MEEITEEVTVERTIIEVKNLRVEIDKNIKEAKIMKFTLSDNKRQGIREVSLVITKLQEAKMWAGKILEELGSELPVPFRDEAK
jgi:hypothetical protein